MITEKQYYDAQKVIEQYMKEQDLRKSMHTGDGAIDGYRHEFIDDCRIISISQLAARNKTALIDIIQQP